LPVWFRTISNNPPILPLKNMLSSGYISTMPPIATQLYIKQMNMIKIVLL
jgi:hypothetical protein